MTIHNPTSLCKHSEPNYGFMQVNIWRRQMKLWVYACYENERESLPSKISVFLGMDACLFETAEQGRQKKNKIV